jgi:hypothetical protein
MTDAEHELARRCYGYGRWDAPYWFIGPEEGQSPRESNSLKLRYKAFRELSKDGLSDCGVFHGFIHETRWHKAAKPALQPAWRCLILLLMTFLKKGADNESLRIYQRDRFGRLDGETCVIELSGLPARNLSVPRKRELFREERIKFIRGKILACKPKFVVMYGRRDLKHWNQIADDALRRKSVQKVGCTIFAVAKHPVARGPKKYWVKLGQRMLKECAR